MLLLVVLDAFGHWKWAISDCAESDGRFVAHYAFAPLVGGPRALGHLAQGCAALVARRTGRCGRLS
eukprot:5004486-Alexandrium_andersonii.AAC.1